MISDCLVFHHFSSTLAGRYLTKICDQVVVLLSPEQSASIVWDDEQSNAEPGDMDAGDDRLFTFEVAEMNEQEETAVARPGYQVPSYSSHMYRFPLILP